MGKLELVIFTFERNMIVLFFYSNPGFFVVLGTLYFLRAVCVVALLADDALS